MLLGMCIYYLQSIVPGYVIVWLASLLFLSIGVYYLIMIDHSTTTISRRIRYIIALLCITGSLLIILYSYKATSEATSLWQTKYADAHAQANREDKALLLDFSAQWCSLCHELEKKVLHNLALDQLSPLLVPVVIDCTNVSAEPCASLQKKYHVVGLPALLLVDPKTDKVIRRWGSELLMQSPCTLSNELKSLLPS